MARRLPPTCLVGLGLILAGLAEFGIQTWWVHTRIWDPLDTPVSLAKGHFRSPEFRINADADYWFLVDTGRPLRMSWSLSEDGQVTARGVCDQEKWCDFHASPGLYRIDLDIADNDSRMNAEVPRLKVFVLGHPAELRELQACVLFLALSFSGMVTIPRLFAWRLEKEQAVAVALWSALRVAPVESVRVRLRRAAPRCGRKRRWPLSPVSLFGFMATSILILALIPMPLIHFWQFQFPISSGLLVRVTRPGIHLPQSPGIQPLLIWVEPDQRGKEPRLFIDSQRISWHDLDSILRKEIVRRPPDWPVYVGGNERLEFGQVARVIDAVRGLRATPALLTRRSALNTGALR